MVQKTIRTIGDNNSKINITGNEKTGFTLILIISASGVFLTHVLVWQKEK